MVKCVKSFLTCSLITVQNLVVICDTVHAHVRGPQIYSDAGDPLTVDGGVADP